MAQMALCQETTTGTPRCPKRFSRVEFDSKSRSDVSEDDRGREVLREHERITLGLLRCARARRSHSRLADARTYPKWWTPVYLDVQSDGPPAVGRQSTEYFKGRLPIVSA